MKLSEVAQVIIQPQYGFGAEQHQAAQATVPSDSTLFYTVELVELQKVRPGAHAVASSILDQLNVARLSAAVRHAAA